jgi:glycerophosphoryl diester phosphodiesterase
MAGIIAARLCIVRAVQKRRVEFVAHRGESFLAPENTMAAFELAGANDADAVELDVHLTKDGRLIVCHDADTQRTHGIKLVIAEHTAEELTRLNLPLLEEVIATIPEGKRLFIEIKCGPEATAELARLVDGSGKTNEQFVVISFRADVLVAAKKRLPGLKTFFLSDFKQDQQTNRCSPTIEELIAKAKEIGADGLDLEAKAPMDASAVKVIQAAGLECSVWTVDEPVVARRLIEYGVDAITTNRAAWLKQQVQR